MPGKNFSAAQFAASASAGEPRSVGAFADREAWHAYQDQWFATLTDGEVLPPPGNDGNRLLRWTAARRQRGKIEAQREKEQSRLKTAEWRPSGTSGVPHVDRVVGALPRAACNKLIAYTDAKIGKDGPAAGHTFFKQDDDLGVADDFSRSKLNKTIGKTTVDNLCNLIGRTSVCGELEGTIKYSFFLRTLGAEEGQQDNLPMHRDATVASKSTPSNPCMGV